jgi:Protein of unknown function (DUF3052)
VSLTPDSGDPVTGGRATPTPGIAERMGFKPGMVVQELGYDDDVDDNLRVAIEEFVGEEMVDEDSDDVVDVVLLWYRDDDGDLVDVLVDTIAPLADNGFIWLLTPKRGRPGYVEPSDIAEAAPTAGLSQTSLATIGPAWGAARLVARKSRQDKR